MRFEMKQLPSKVIVIGAGPSGLFAARRLYQIAKEQGKKIEIVFLEREDVVGGKCHTYQDPIHPELRSEWGAGAVAPNYGVVIDAIKECKVDFEEMIHVEDNTVEIKKLYDGLTVRQKISFINTLRAEICAFNKDYDRYKAAVKNKTELRADLEYPFSEYCALHNMKYLPMAVKPFVPGFGYGAVSHIPTYSVMEYLGKTTIPEILVVDNFTSKPSLLAIHGGFQVLMEKMAEGYDVRLNSQVKQIKREPNKVMVNYMQNGKEHTETADHLILATSPKNWSSLGLDMTPVEKECVKELEYYRYPVAVYKIHGLPAHQYYFPAALEAKGFGHIALITSRDNRPNPVDGRLCTIYVNLPPGANDFTFDHQQMEKELKMIPGVTGVTVIKDKIWEDYMSTLPMRLRLALAKEQSRSNTDSLGSFGLGGFEDVACVAELATNAMNNKYTLKPKDESSFSNNFGRFLFFFKRAKVHQPLNAFEASLDVRELNAASPVVNH